MISIAALLIGALLIGAGAYYLVKEKQDHESRKVYLVTLLAGAALALGGLAGFIAG